ncbi:MAG TPA: hypothetical protein VGL60_07640 [Acidimicrobiales bacterium]
MAEGADDDAVQRERLGGGPRLAHHGPPPACGGEGAHSSELLVGHERLVGERLGDDPGVLVVPPHLADVAERDVLDVEEHLVAALAVPHLAPGVARVGEDRPHRHLRPRKALPMAVAGPVVGGGAGDAVAGQPFGDGVQATACHVLVEDAAHHRGRVRVRLQAVPSLAHCRLARVGVRSGVGQLVAVGRPSAEEAPLGAGLCGHGGADADLDAVALSLGHPAVERHHEDVGVRSRVDGASHLGHPQLHAVVGEDGEGEAELVAVEGAGGLADDDRLEAAVRPGQRVEERGRLGAAIPR